MIERFVHVIRNQGVVVSAASELRMHILGGYVEISGVRIGNLEEQDLSIEIPLLLETINALSAAQTTGPDCN